MKILVINCSPVRNGATAEIVNTVKQYVENVGSAQKSESGAYRPNRSSEPPTRSVYRHRKNTCVVSPDKPTVNPVSKVTPTLYIPNRTAKIPTQKSLAPAFWAWKQELS